MSLYTASYLETNSLNSHFVFFFLLFSTVGISLINLQQWSAKIFGHHFTLCLFDLGNIVMETFAMFTGDGCHVFRRNVQMGMQKVKFQ
jgi:hypothetical protein